MEYKTDDLRIVSIKAVTSPLEICEEIPISDAAEAHRVLASGETFGKVLLTVES